MTAYILIKHSIDGDNDIIITSLTTYGMANYILDNLPIHKIQYHDAHLLAIDIMNDDNLVIHIDETISQDSYRVIQRPMV